MTTYYLRLPYAAPPMPRQSGPLGRSAESALKLPDYLKKGIERRHLPPLSGRGLSGRSATIKLATHIADGIERRGSWNRQIQEMDHLFTNHKMSDPLTRQIVQWRDKIVQRPPAESLAQQRDTQLNALQELDLILKDALVAIPLNDKPLLGSDGRTYNSKSFALWQKLIRLAPHHLRSPLEPSNPAVFTVTPHPIATYMVQWLRSQATKRPTPYEETVNRDYENLTQAGQLPRLPTPAYVRALQLEDVRQAAEAARQLEIGAATAQLESDLAGRTTEFQRDLRARVGAGAMEGLMVVEEGAREQTEIEEKMAWSLLDFNERYERLESALQEAETQRSVNHAGLDRITDGVAQGHAGNQMLKQMAQDTKTALDRRDEAARAESKRSAFEAIATIAACAVASYCLAQYGMQVGPGPRGTTLSWITKF